MTAAKLTLGLNMYDGIMGRALFYFGSVYMIERILLCITIIVGIARRRILEKVKKKKQ